jgi:hypothetical protein
MSNQYQVGCEMAREDLRRGVSNNLYQKLLSSENVEEKEYALGYQETLMKARATDYEEFQNDWLD